MGTGDVRVITRAGLVLLVASGARAWVLGGREDPSLRDAASQLEPLLEASREAALDGAVRTRPLNPGERVDPNRASEQELDRLPGVGPALAARIVRERDNGPYLSVADLERVPGIGPAKRGALAPLLELSAAPATRSASTNAGSRARSWDLATMSASELEDLDGIGPVLAARIVEHRASGGRLRVPEDLLAVSGIGPATLRRIESSLVERRWPP